MSLVAPSKLIIESDVQAGLNLCLGTVNSIGYVMHWLLKFLYLKLSMLV